MFCPNCGSQINIDSKFCGKCGKPVGETTAIKKFSSIVDTVESHYSWMLSKDFSGLDLKQRVSKIMYQSIGKTLKEKLGDAVVRISHKITEREEVTKMLNESAQDGDISSAELQEIHKSKQYKDYFGILDRANPILGRYQLLGSVRNILGEKVTEEEHARAYKNDISEYDSIFNGLESIKSFINSNGGLINNEVAIKVSKDITSLIQEGYKLCVLQNNSDLETACLKIRDDSDERALEAARHQNKEKETVDLIERMNGLLAGQKYMRYSTLGQSDENPPRPFVGRDQEMDDGKLIKSPQQKTWWILETVAPQIVQQKLKLTDTHSSLISWIIGSYCANSAMDKATLLGEDIMSFAKSLITKGILNPDNLKVIEREIALGMTYGKN